MVIVLAKNTTHVVLYFEKITRVGNVNLMIILDIVEVMVTIYTLYSLHIFSLCLQQGKISEYEPRKKFFWFAFLAFTIIIQKFLIHRITEASIVAEDTETR